MLGPGDEFGIPLCSDRKPHDPLTDFGEYAKTAPVEFGHESKVEVKTKSLAERTDGKAELLSIRRQDWEATLQCSRYTRGFGVVVGRVVVNSQPVLLPVRALLHIRRITQGHLEEVIPQLMFNSVPTRPTILIASSLLYVTPYCMPTLRSESERVARKSPLGTTRSRQCNQKRTKNCGVARKLQMSPHNVPLVLVLWELISCNRRSERSDRCLRKNQNNVLLYSKGRFREDGGRGHCQQRSGYFEGSSA